MINVLLGELLLLVARLAAKGQVALDKIVALAEKPENAE